MSNELLIGRGAVEPEAWQRYLELGKSLGAQVLEQSVETEDFEESRDDGDYAGIDDFHAFASENGINDALATKAYRGLFRIYHAQQRHFEEISDMPHLKFSPTPEYEVLGYLFQDAGKYNVDIGSLQLFLGAVEDKMASRVSDVTKVRFRTEVLPRTVGMGLIELYQNFVSDRIDKS